jgi:hypothetical protein
MECVVVERVGPARRPALDLAIVYFADLGIEQLELVFRRKVQVEEDARFTLRREGITMEAATSGSRELHLDIVVVEVNGVVAR